MNAVPKDAAAVVLLRSAASETNPEIYWIKRSLRLGFLGGYHAFPGGKLEKSDAATPVENCADSRLSGLIACAAREAFEETGVLLVRGGDKLTKGQRASLHDDLISGRMTFGEILAHWNLRLDGEDFRFLGSWTTPPFSPVRFKTGFFLVRCPPKQTPFAASGELEAIENISPENALKRWQNAEILCAPPIYYTVKALSEGLNESSLEKLLKIAAEEGEHPREIRFNPRVALFPVKTETLPPATHTNCFVVGRREFIVIDAAATDAGEQAALHRFVDSLIEGGGACREIIVSHFHPDHVGGERALQQHLRGKYRMETPISAHRLTSQKLPEINFDRFLEGGEQFVLRDEAGAPFELEVLHLPGHARGHLCFYDAEFGFLLSSDNVVGAGSVLIAPPEGNMSDYLNSLERMRDLPNLRFLCGSHGAAIADARAKIENYIAHRLTREQQILAAWQAGARTPGEIVAEVYRDVPPEVWSWAEKSVAAHLEKLQTDNEI